MRFGGTNWAPVGKVGFSTRAADWTSLALSPTGQPYVAYVDEANSFNATVMKYDSILTGISEPQQLQTSLYPNPARDKITIETSGMPKEITLEIVNIEGQQLITRQISQPKTQIDISTLPSGVYFVRVINNRTVQVGKFVKQ
jgi:hypothetical protein